MQHRKMSAWYIPDAILAEILKRLPVKSLLRCRCVQKSWYYLIQTPYLINLHSNYNQKINTENPKYLLFRSLDSLSLCLRYDDDQCEEFQQLKVHPGIECCCNWLAASSSLICLSIVPVRVRTCSDIYLWNPFINKYKTLPMLNLSLISWRYFNWANLSFGYVPSVSDYRVVKIINYYASNRIDRSFLVCVYSLNTNSWKIKIIEDKFLVDVPEELEFVSVNGVSFWIADKENLRTLLSYDTMNDVLHNISLPQVSWDSSLHQFGQSLAYFIGEHNSNVFSMWILKEDSMNGFLWEKKISVNLDEGIGAQVLGIRNNGELILSRRLSDLVSYNVEHKEVNDFVKSWNCWPCNAHKVLDYNYYQPWRCWCTNALNNDNKYYQQPPFFVQPLVDGLVLLNMDRNH